MRGRNMKPENLRKWIARSLACWKTWNGADYWTIRWSCGVAEIGRTPMVENGDGRNHHPKAFTMWMAGGGVCGGLTYGSTDDFGYVPAENPVHMSWIDGWPGLEGASPKPRGFLRSAQASPGHPIHQSKSDRALVPQFTVVRSPERKSA